MNNLVSIVIPTRNEEKNIGKLLARIAANVSTPCEAIVVDDSSDRTAEIAKANKAKVVKGKGQGLGQAIIDGIETSSGDIVIVMDSDGQHKPSDILKLLKPILEEGCDMTIGSRYIKGGSNPGWSLKRRIVSKVACLLALPVTRVKDATSGFFAFRKNILQEVKLKPTSWKIMLEVLVKANPTKVVEVPIVFEERQAGESKFNSKQMIAYLKHLFLLVLYKYQALLKFGVIGLSGAVIHFALLYTLTDIAHFWYIFSAILSIIAASTSNYILNHKLTFTDRQISNHLLGWVKYQAMSGITDGMYLGLLALFVEIAGMWYMAGALLAVLIIYPVKFAVASTVIWSKKISTREASYEWNAFYKGSLVQKWWKQSIAKTVWEWVPVSSTLLDIGCGSSPVISHYPNAVGIDTNKEKLTFIKEKCPTITVKAMSADMLMFGENSFDYILCIEVLEHLPRPELTVAMISNVLKVGGKVVIATPDYSKPLWHIAEKFTPYKEEHITQFTRKSLEEVCKKYGLTPIRHKYIATCDLIELFEKEA